MLKDERDENKTETFFYRDGIEQFVRQLGRSKQPLHPKPIAISGKRQSKIDGKDEDVFVDCVLQYNDSYTDQILCFANSIPNPDGGTHLTGFRSRADPRHQSIRQAEQFAEGKGPGDFRRRRARRPGLRVEREAAESALRVADQGQAGEHGN